MIGHKYIYSACVVGTSFKSNCTAILLTSSVVLATIKTLTAAFLFPADILHTCSLLLAIMFQLSSYRGHL